MRFRAERYDCAIISCFLLSHFTGRPSRGRAIFKSDVVIDDNLVWLAYKIGQSWSALALHLRFDAAEISTIERECSRLSDAAIRMLRSWKKRMGSKATYIRLYHALAHESVGRKDLAEMIWTHESSAVVSFVFLTISVVDFFV